MTLMGMYSPIDTTPMPYGYVLTYSYDSYGYASQPGPAGHHSLGPWLHDLVKAPGVKQTQLVQSNIDDIKGGGGGGL